VKKFMRKAPRVFVEVRQMAIANEYQQVTSQKPMFFYVQFETNRLCGIPKIYGLIEANQKAVKAPVQWSLINDNCPAQFTENLAPASFFLNNPHAYLTLRVFQL
jgi:hypothetical protein